MRSTFVWLPPSIAGRVCYGSFSPASRLRICRVLGAINTSELDAIESALLTYQWGSSLLFCWGTTVEKRLWRARTLSGFSQLQLDAGTSNTRPLISMDEHGRANLSVANVTTSATGLGISVDFRRGLTTDPTPARELAKELAVSTTRVRDLEQQQAYVAAPDDGDYVGVSELADAARGGGGGDHERLTSRLKFRREWLPRHGLAAGECRVIQVLGGSMEPTLFDGCSILVNPASRRRTAGRIFVVRTEDGLVLKRAGKDRTGVWQLLSDNPKKQACPTVLWPDEAPVIGEVRRVRRAASGPLRRQRHLGPSLLLNTVVARTRDSLFL